MKTYLCDACHGIINDPYVVKMKEFYVGYFIDDHGVQPCNSKNKKKIHLCDKCFHALKEVAENSVQKETNR